MSEAGSTQLDARASVASPECPICLGGPWGLDAVLLIPCSHQFCRSCITHWATKKQWCPLCKGQFRGWCTKGAREEREELPVVESQGLQEPAAEQEREQARLSALGASLVSGGASWQAAREDSSPAALRGAPANAARADVAGADVARADTTGAVLPVQIFRNTAPVQSLIWLPQLSASFLASEEGRRRGVPDWITSPDWSALDSRPRKKRRVRNDKRSAVASGMGGQGDSQGIPGSRGFAAGSQLTRSELAVGQVEESQLSGNQLAAGQVAGRQQAGSCGSGVGRGSVLQTGAREAGAHHRLGRDAVSHGQHNASNSTVPAAAAAAAAGPHYGLGRDAGAVTGTGSGASRENGGTRGVPSRHYLRMQRLQQARAGLHRIEGEGGVGETNASFQ